MAFRVIAFSGYRWDVKTSKGRVGPGPNRFGADDVRVDAGGRLHLGIVGKKGGWFCSEVVLGRSLGYGEYRFVVRKEDLDDNAVFGMFLWDARAPRLHFREVDIELSRWGDPRKANAQFAVQPYQRAGNLVRFELPEGLAELSFSCSNPQTSGRETTNRGFGVPRLAANRVRVLPGLSANLPRLIANCPQTSVCARIICQRV
jgi:hypothetical protein